MRPPLFEDEEEEKEDPRGTGIFTKPLPPFDPNVAAGATYREEFDILFPDFKQNIDIIKKNNPKQFEGVDNNDLLLAVYGSIVQEHAGSPVKTKQVGGAEGKVARGIFQLQPNNIADGLGVIAKNPITAGALLESADLSPISRKYLEQGLGSKKDGTDFVKAAETDTNLQALIKSLSLLRMSSKREALAGLGDKFYTSPLMKSDWSSPDFWDEIKKFQGSSKSLYEQISTKPDAPPADVQRAKKLQTGLKEMTTGSEYLKQYKFDKGIRRKGDE
jgi:hypothetical protein